MANIYGFVHKSSTTTFVFLRFYSCLSYVIVCSLDQAFEFWTDPTIKRNKQTRIKNSRFCIYKAKKIKGKNNTDLFLLISYTSTLCILNTQPRPPPCPTWESRQMATTVFIVLSFSTLKWMLTQPYHSILTNIQKTLACEFWH